MNMVDTSLQLSAIEPLPDGGLPLYSRSTPSDTRKVRVLGMENSADVRAFVAQEIADERRKTTTELLEKEKVIEGLRKVRLRYRAF